MHAQQGIRLSILQLACKMSSRQQRSETCAPASQPFLAIFEGHLENIDVPEATRDNMINVNVYDTPGTCVVSRIHIVEIRGIV